MLNLKQNNVYPVASRFSNLAEIVEKKERFNIPIYQRLYVWKDEQIKALLEDLEKGFRKSEAFLEAGITGELPDFYLGGVILSQNHLGQFDLIDGQQRFTTLWLIGSVIKNALLDFNFVQAEKETIASLSFSIRDFANEFFNNPENRTESAPKTEAVKAELKPIVKAINTIKLFIEDRKFTEKQKELFAKYLMHQIRFMVTVMPTGTDENKLFEVMNNRGQQLQHHEILKPRLLKYIVCPAERSKYAQIWDACALMNNYLERNIKEITNSNWADLTNSSGANNEVGLPVDILSKLKALDQKDPQSLLAILTGQEKLQPDTKKDENDPKYDAHPVRSILSFPMLLLHVLRIFQFEKNANREEKEIAEVDEKKLLAIFEEHFEKFLNDTPTLLKEEKEKNVKYFLQLLWTIRMKFDQHVIKWINEGGNERLAVEKLYQNDGVLTRREADKQSGFTQLQAMLYHAQESNSRYWLTPLLNKMQTCDDTTELFNYLRNLDNALFCAGNSQALRVRSWQLMNPGSEKVHPDVRYLELGAHKGTGYHSYVFYKLDFVLWYLRDSIFEKKKLQVSKKEDWDNYRLTSKNSVEHISPQNSQEIDMNLVWERTDEGNEKARKLNDFGNLVLLTSSMNSEYSNHPYAIKRSKFMEKAQNNRLDSLKSALIFENEHWNWDLCQTHRNEMINYLQAYLSQN